MFDTLFSSVISQIVPATIESFGVWVPLAFGLALGLGYFIAASARKAR